MTNLFSQRVTVPDHVLMRELDGESVILDLTSENYFGLDDVGTRLWQVISTSDTIAEAYDSLLLEYEVEPEQLQGDLQDFITQLAAKNLLKIEAVTQERTPD